MSIPQAKIWHAYGGSVNITLVTTIRKRLLSIVKRWQALNRLCELRTRVIMAILKYRVFMQITEYNKHVT